MDASRKSKIPEDNTNNRPSTSTGNSTNPIDKNANIAHSQSFSKNEHIVIIQANDKISVTDSIAAIQTFVNQSNIEPQISKIEISLYLSDKKQEESILEALEKNTMGHDLLTKPSVQEAKRIILYGIKSTIPDEEILEKLRSMKITPILPIARVSLAMTGLISDLDRQIYIRPEDIKKLSDHIEIDYENITHYINIRSDNSTILIMDKNGLQGSSGMQHIQKAVPKKNNEDEDSYYDRVLSPIRDVFKSVNNPYIFNYNVLKEFLKATKKRKCILSIVDNFIEITKELTSKQYNAITKMLLYIKKHITERNMNNRIKLLVENLKIEWEKRKKKSSSKAKNKLKDRIKKTQYSRKKQKKSVGIKTNPNIVNKISLTIGGSVSTKKQN